MSELHNPDHLTDAQIGVSDGWRLLDEDEIDPRTMALVDSTCELWWDKWVSRDANGSPILGMHSFSTYRTRLTRAELRAARGLPPISEPSDPNEAMRQGIGIVSSAPATPLFKSDDEMLISLTGSAKEVVLKNPDGSTWTPSAPAAPAPAGDEATPRTDSHFNNLHIHGGVIGSSWLNFARTLERELSASRREVAEIARERDEAVHWAAKLSKALIKTDECVGTATEKLHTANRENDFLRAQLTSIGDEIEAINKSREEQAVNLAKVSRENEELKVQLATVTVERDEVAKRMADDNMEFRRRVVAVENERDQARRHADNMTSLGQEIRTQLGTTAEQLQAAVAERDRLLLDLRDMTINRDGAQSVADQAIGYLDAAESRSRAAEAARAVMREALEESTGYVDKHWPDSYAEPLLVKMRAALATDAGQPLLDELEKAKKDGALIDAVESACWDVRCEDIPTGQGDADVGWTVIEHHMAAPHEREVGIGGDTVRDAIRAAIAQKEGE